MSTPQFEEDDLSTKLDDCFINAGLKTLWGLFLGTGYSFLFYKRSKWPIIAGGVIGGSLALVALQDQLNLMFKGKPDLVPEYGTPPRDTDDYHKECQ